MTGPIIRTVRDAQTLLPSPAEAGTPTPPPRPVEQGAAGPLPRPVRHLVARWQQAAVGRAERRARLADAHRGEGSWT